jgi:excisionase family DNA binding protein
MGVKNPQWGTVAEAAVILGVSAGTVDRWKREGRVTFRHLGQRLSLIDVARLAEVGDEQYMRERAAK